MSRLRDALLGVLYLALAGGLVATSLAVYSGAFSRDIGVTLEAGTVGNALRVGSDVKFLGVPVGKVAGIRPHGAGGGATIELLIDGDQARQIPRDSVVRMTPATLFGERYVSIIPTTTSMKPLTEGASLTQDVSDAALQSEDLFESLLPVLQAVEPAKLNATLGELATALRGQGDSTGDAMVRWGAYLAKLRPYVPALAKDLELLGRVSQAYADASPALLAGLDDLTTMTGTLHEKRQELDALLAGSTVAAGEGTDWLEKNSGQLVGLAREARTVLAVLARYAPLFPCVTASVTDLMPRMDKVLGQGSNEPGLHAQVQIVPEGSGDGAGAFIKGCPSVRKAGN